MKMRQYCVVVKRCCLIITANASFDEIGKANTGSGYQPSENDDERLNERYWKIKFSMWKIVHGIARIVHLCTGICRTTFNAYTLCSRVDCSMHITVTNYAYRCRRAKHIRNSRQCVAAQESDQKYIVSRLTSFHVRCVCVCAVPSSLVFIYIIPVCK